MKTFAVKTYFTGKNMPTLSRDHARAIAIAAQGLNQRPAHVDKAAVHATIQKLAVVQIDTINVVARAPYFVLWSRLGDYDPLWFEQLHFPDGQLFEYWAHAASFVPIEHWRWLRPAMRDYSVNGWKRAVEWIHEHRDVVDFVKNEIRERGPLRAADFEAPDDHSASGWWNWKPAKTALDVLWSMGELMILRRIKFQRVYELTERVMPDWNDADTPTPDQAYTALAEHGLRAMGIATERHLPDYFRQKRNGMAQLLKTWVAEGRAIQLKVAGWDKPAYVHHDNQHLLDTPPKPELTTLLVPFDSLIWDRQRTLDLWDFDYKIECYTPAPKRKYGYFTLPILWRDQLVGRVDAKAERKNGIFRVFSIHFEPNVTITSDMLDDVAQTLRDCAAWHRTPQVIIEKTAPESAIAELQARV